MDTETTWSEFPNGLKATTEQILGSEDRNKLKKAGKITTRDLSKKLKNETKAA